MSPDARCPLVVADLEVCLFSQICRNGDELFRLEVGESFSCDFSNEGLWELEALLHTAGELNPEADVCEPWKMGQRG